MLGSGPGITYASVPKVVSLLEIAAESLFRFLGNRAVEVGLRYAVLFAYLLFGQTSACDSEEAIAMDATAKLGC